MITKNFKNFLKTILTSQGSSYNKGKIAATNTSGATKYLTGGGSGFPNSVQGGITFSEGYSGLCLGTGTTPATEDDYKLDNMTTNASSSPYALNVNVQWNDDVDDQGNPRLTFTITIRNNGKIDYPLSEIGYVQTLGAADNLNSTDTSSTSYFLLDRTVLPEPIVISAGKYGVVTYTLKTIL